MIEIKNVSKIYGSKGGVETRALDDVSITFGETGLVFLLGKSGSGKSTLLNVAGGLDEPTSGEVVVKGKSSKDFSGSDFDSYRNTFVGFVFQEYNILDEFNVEDNIALALELQGKPKDKEKIAQLLEDVDLISYAKRKPNTLSGGQKQRIAIARALVKDPQIIMADEPTGALDSATGKQVFETLKKLSETRLVIVVSHDREFAETYGDRIVELKDGKIISDVSKRAVPPEKLDENVSVLNGNTMTLKSGATLTDKNLKDIREFLKGSEGDVIITRGSKQVELFKKANRIGEDGCGETFTDTQEKDVEIKEYTPEESKFIRSRLPVGKAIKIGASGLKLKPLRLFFTIILSFVAFTLFGLFSTLMTYDVRAIAANSFAENGEDYITLGKNYHYRYVDDSGKVTQDGDYQYSSAEFSPEEVNSFKQKFGAKTFAVFGGREMTITNVSGNPDLYYKNAVYLLSATENNTHSIALSSGAYPQKDNEIAISSYTLSVLKELKIFLYNENGEKVDENGNAVAQDVEVSVDEASVLGKYIMLNVNYGNGSPFKVTGVFSSGEIPQKYEPLKTDEGKNDYMLQYDYTQWLQSSLPGMAIVSDGFYAAYGSSLGGNTFVNEFKYLEDNSRLKIESEYGTDFIYSVKVYDENAYFPVTFLGTEKTSLNSNEIIVNPNQLKSIISKLWSDCRNDLIATYETANPEPQDEWEWRNDNHSEPLQEWQWDGQNPEPQWYGSEFEDQDSFERRHAQWEADRQAAIDAHDQWEAERQQVVEAYNDWLNARQAYSDELTDIGNRFSTLTSILQGQNYWDDDAQQFVAPTAAKRQEALTELKSLIAEYFEDGLVASVSIGERSPQNYNVVGWYDSSIASGGDGIYISEQLSNSLTYQSSGGSTQQTNYKPARGSIYTTLFIPYNKTTGDFLKLYDMCGYQNVDKETDVFYEITSSLYNSIKTVDGFATMFTSIFLWVGVVFAVFAALLLFNFISMSISNKRKEIGILRAVGARGTDVFKIFFAESGIIVGICLILSVIGSAVLCSVLNGILRSTAGIMVTLFVFGVTSILMMLGIAVVVAFISTFLPVYFAAKKKPVESIRAL